MKRITIGRYGQPQPGDTPNRPDPGEYSGWIEGVRDDDSSWIMFIDADGNPSSYWPLRDANGAVVDEEGIGLTRKPGQFSGVFSWLGVPDDADDTTDPNNQVISTFPVWHPGGDNPGPGLYPEGTMRGVVFAVVPGEQGYAARMRKFVEALAEGFGMSTGAQRRDKLKDILRDPDPVAVVARLRAAVDADLDAPEVRGAVKATLDRKTTLEVSEARPDGNQL